MIKVLFKKKIVIDIQKIIRFSQAKCQEQRKLQITGFNSLEQATSSEIAFFVGKSLTKELVQSKAEAVFVNQDFSVVDSQKMFLFVDNPKLAFFQSQEKFSCTKSYSKKIHSQAVVEKSAKIGKNVTIYPFAHIDHGAQIGDNSVVYSHCYLGEDAKIGENCIIHANCSILNGVILGNKVIIHSGCVLGSDGFGFVTEKEIHYKIAHQGTVEVADQVEIGAGCAIDRGTFGNTKIGKGTKLDNLIHIGHNVQIGENCLIAGQVGIAGSTKLGNSVYCGGQVGILGHNIIEDGCVFHPGTIFMQERKTVPAKSHMAGIPAISIQEWRRNIVVQKKLAHLEKKVRNLENNILSTKS